MVYYFFNFSVGLKIFKMLRKNKSQSYNDYIFMSSSSQNNVLHVMGLVPKGTCTFTRYSPKSLPQFTFLYVHFYLYTLMHTGNFQLSEKLKNGNLALLHLKKLLLILNILVSLKNNFSMFSAHFSY